MSELILLFALCILVRMLSRPFSPHAQLVIWIVVVIWTAGTLVTHGRLVSYDGIGLVWGDSSVDALKYYETAEDIQGDITSSSITALSGSTWNHGYYYLNAVAVSVSSRPMLAIRLFKLTLFMVAILYLARMWRGYYGERLAILGLLYLSLGYWELFYYNFRNLKDGVIVSLVMLLFVAVEKMRRPNDSQLPQRSSQALIWCWFVVAALLICLFQFRSYLAISMTACICLALLLARYGINLRSVVSLVAVGGLCRLLILLLENFHGLDLATGLVSGLHSKSSIEIGENIIRSIAGPIPWQHSVPYMIPSHCAYLIVLLIAIYACVTRFSAKVLWQVIFVVSVIFFGALLDNSGWRRRLPVIPFLVTWVLADLSARWQRCDSPRSTNTGWG